MDKTNICASDWRSEDKVPVYRVPEWSELGKEFVGADETARHFLMLGETGSGKTRSGIMPILGSILSWSRDPELTAGAFIIDPKREIRGELDRHGIQIDEFPSPKAVLHFFEGLNIGGVKADLIADRLIRLLPHSVMSNEKGFFRSQARMTMTALVDIELTVFKARGTRGLVNFWDSVRAFFAEEKKDASDDGVPLTACLRYYRNKMLERHMHAIYNIVALHPCIARACGKSLANCAGAAVISALGAQPPDQRGGVISTTVNYLEALHRVEETGMVSFNPFEEPDGFLSVEGVMNSGRRLIHEPGSDTDTGELIGKCVKSKVFELSFKRANQRRPFLYACDEFQRFITGDPLSGEQSYLDRCRAHRVSCILATQSMASLSYAVKFNTGFEAADDTCGIILNNTGNKFFFRNTDPETLMMLERLIPFPHSRSRLHIAKVRPASTLAPGECYHLLCDGSWGRSQIRLNTGSAKAA